MLNAQDEAMLCDFGISRIFHQDSNSTSTAPYSTLRTMIGSPEMRANWSRNADTYRPSVPGDVFACGVMLLSLGLPPAFHVPGEVYLIQVQEEARGIVKGFVNPSITSFEVPKPAHWAWKFLADDGHDLWALVQRMTAYAAEDRPTMIEVQKDLERIFSGFV